MGATLIPVQQVRDIDGKIAFNSNNSILIASSATTEIFTGSGILMGVGIWKDVDGGTIYFTDTAGDPIAGLPNVTNKGVLDYPGTFPTGRIEITGGLKVVTASATGLVMSVYSFTEV